MTKDIQEIRAVKNVRNETRTLHFKLICHQHLQSHPQHPSRKFLQTILTLEVATTLLLEIYYPDGWKCFQLHFNQHSLVLEDSETLETVVLDI